MNNNKKTILSYSQRLLLLVAMLFAVSGVTFAQNWTPPTSNPPAGNVPAPINVGPSVQTKQGALQFGASRTRFLGHEGKNAQGQTTSSGNHWFMFGGSVEGTHNVLGVQMNSDDNPVLFRININSMFSQDLALRRSTLIFNSESAPVATIMSSASVGAPTGSGRFNLYANARGNNLLSGSEGASRIRMHVDSMGFFLAPANTSLVANWEEIMRISPNEVHIFRNLRVDGDTNLFGPVNICTADGSCQDIRNIAGGDSLWSPGSGNNIFRGEGNVGIGTSNPQSRLHVVSTGDGAEVLRLGTERPWVFQQENTGANSALTLRSTVNSKYFNITSLNGVRVARFHASDSPNSNQVFLAPEGGRVGIGTYNPQSTLDVSGDVCSTVGGVRRCLSTVSGGESVGDSLWSQGTGHNGRNIFYNPGDPFTVAIGWSGNQNSPYTLSVAGMIATGRFHAAPPGNPMNSPVDPTYGFADGGGLGMYTPSSNTLSFAAGGVERFRITSHATIGNNINNSRVSNGGISSGVGISTPSPNNNIPRLFINNSGSTDGTNQGLYVFNPSSGMAIVADGGEGRGLRAVGRDSALRVEGPAFFSNAYGGPGGGIMVQSFSNNIPNFSPDVNGDGVVNAIDVQLAINCALGLSQNVPNCSRFSAVEVQRVINASLGLSNDPVNISILSQGQIVSQDDICGRVGNSRVCLSDLYLGSSGGGSSLPLGSVNQTLRHTGTSAGWQSTSAISVLNNGNVGIGTSNPQDNRLFVNGFSRINGGLRVDGQILSGAVGAFMEPDFSGIAVDAYGLIRIRAGNPATNRVLVSSNGVGLSSWRDVNSIPSTSDLRLKNNVKSLSGGGLSVVGNLRPVSFDWIEDGRSDIGLIAQEVEKVSPDLVDIDENGIKSVFYSKITIHLIEAVKEQQAQIESLEERIEALEAKLMR